MSIEIPTDKVIGSKRNRGLRNIVMGLYAGTCALTIPPIVHTIVTMPFLKNEMAMKLVDGLATGLGWMALVGLLGYTIPKKFLIRNDPNRMFLTQDGLASFFGSGLVDVPYGPGLHASYPWEKRIQGGNISLEESTVTFDFAITLPEGRLTGEGSYWLRPDHMAPVVFLRSVASVGEEIQNLVIAKIEEFIASDEFQNKAVETTNTPKIIDLINKHLIEVFGDDNFKAEVEKNNGVIVSGATVKDLALSPDLEKSLNAVAEARAVQKGTAMILGMTAEEMNTSVRNGSLSNDDVARARRDFLSISGNLEGMEIKRTEFDLNIRGISPESIDKLTELAKTPAAQAAAGRWAQGGGTKQGKK